MADVSGDREVLGRVVDRLRSLSEARLARPDASLPAGSIAAECHDLAAWAAAAGGETAKVPLLHPLASGDQLAVIGRELLDDAEEDTGALTEWRTRVRRLRDRL